MPRVELVTVAAGSHSHRAAESLWQALLAFSADGVDGRVVALVALWVWPGKADAVAVEVVEVVVAGAMTVVQSVCSMTPIVAEVGEGVCVCFTKASVTPETGGGKVQCNTPRRRRRVS